MQKALAVVLALLVVVAALLPQPRHWLAAHLVAPRAPLPGAASSTLPDLDIAVPALTFDNIGATPVALEAWSTFEAYLKAADAHDLPTLASLSYQLSSACKEALVDASQSEPCYELMDSVVFFAQDFKQKDFVRVAYDDKQIVLATDYMKAGDAVDPLKAVIYFVRQPLGPKLLGIRFCVGEEGETDECVETSPAKRDTNHNGWWDDVEALFKT
jgi:hypothetical protein